MNGKFIVKMLIIIYIIFFSFDIYSSKFPVYMSEEMVAKLRVDKEKVLEKIKEDPENAKHHDELSIILSELGELDDALMESNIAIGMDSKNPSYLNNRALIYMQMEKYEAAIDDLNKIIDIDPKIPSVYMNLSVIYRDKGEYDKAIEYGKKALEIKDASSYYYHLGTIYMQMGDKDKAREMFSKVISIEGHDSSSSELALKKLEELKALEPKPTGPALDYKGYIPSEEEAVEVALAWLAIVDNEQYEESWKSAADYLKNVIPKEDWVQSLKGVRTRMGKVTSRELKAKEYTRTLVGAPDGEYIVIQYETSFENKQYAVETITPMIDKDGKWRISGYYIR